jgi:AcrR family transcriptional regulator
MRRHEKLSRKEKAARTHDAIVEAALQVVANYGYAKASVSRISDAAGVAQGTIFGYFGTHQNLLSQLLPLEGDRMLTWLDERALGSSSYFDYERRSFTALVSYLEERPYFLRVLIEAKVAAPRSFAEHLEHSEKHYIEIIESAERSKEVRPNKALEYGVIADILTGARAHIAFHLLGRDPAGRSPIVEVDLAVDTYVKFLRQGLGGNLRMEPPLRAKIPRKKSTAAGDVKAAIFKAGEKLILNLGFSKTNVKGLTAQAGIATGSFYTHFASRQEFFEALVRRARRRLVSWLAPAVDGSTNFLERESRASYAFFDLITQEPWLMRIAWEAAVWAPALYARQVLTFRRSYRRLLAREKAKSALPYYRSNELVVVGEILIAARDYFAARHLVTAGAQKFIPDWSRRAYIDLITAGLQSDGHC